MRYLNASFATLLTFALTTGIAAADVDRIYLEEDGIILFEVEDAEPAAGWELKTELADFSSSGYFEWTGSSSFNVNNAGRGNITYHFRVPEAGNYQMRWRSHIAIGDENTEHNDSWVRLSTGQNIVDEEPLSGWTKVFMNTLNQWTWTSNTVDFVGKPIRQFFAAGDHTIEISGRSQGHAIDRIALYRYEEVNYNSVVVNTWNLSRSLLADGSTADPSDPSDPIDEEPVEPPEEVVLENLEILDESWRDHASGECIANTLALPTTAVATFDPTSTTGEFQSGEFITLINGESTAVFKFDFSLLPPVDTAWLQYSTGDSASDGTVFFSLASHSDWPGNSSDDVPFPDVMLVLSEASGGWTANARHQSSIPANLIGNELSTIIINSAPESDPLQFAAQVPSELAPRLMLSGNDSFCQTWQSNIDAQTPPVEPPVEPLEPPVEPPVEPPIEPPVEPPVEPETVLPTAGEEPSDEQDNRTTGSGGSLSWLAILTLILGACIGRVISRLKA